MTTPNQIEQAQAFARRIASQVPLIVRAWVDDWDDNGGFYIFARAKTHHSDGRLITSHNGILLAIRGHLAFAKGRFIWADAPRMQYAGKGQLGRGKYHRGYDRDDYKLNVQFTDRTPPPPEPAPQYACRADMPNS